jgi:isopentenyldiphosphate isomerase
LGDKEVVDVVDDGDSVVGTSTLGRCLELGLLHRAVAVLLERGDGRVLLQQRSRKDRWHPGLWTISSTGHVRSRETYAAAAARELFEELGVSGQPVFRKKYLLPPMKSGGLIEREWTSFYIVRADARVKIDPVEVESTRAVTGAELLKMLDGEDLTPDAVVILRDYLGGNTRDPRL